MADTRPSASAASTQRVGAVGRLALPPSLAGTYAAHVSGLAKSSPAGPHEPSGSLAPGSSGTSSPAPPSRGLSRSSLAKSSDAHLRKVLLRCDSSMVSLVNEEDVQAEARARLGLGLGLALTLTLTLTLSLTLTLTSCPRTP